MNTIRALIDLILRVICGKPCADRALASLTKAMNELAAVKEAEEKAAEIASASARELLDEANEAHRRADRARRVQAKLADLVEA